MLQSPSGNPIGEIQKRNSDMIMNATWNRDIQSKKCYLYDYFHDNPKDKIEVDAKFIISQYGSLSKDQVEYHIMFRPMSGCAVDYYQEAYGKYNAEYPIGLYIDIPNAQGEYKKWLICSSDREQQFVKHSILPCNYHFRWTLDGRLYSMWGIARLRNSYNSGIWTDYLTTIVENQDQIWLPMNEVSSKLYYGHRVIISALIDEPITWKISKVENIHPFGINKLTVAQDKFNPQNDYVNFETGEMYADYYKSAVAPDTAPDEQQFPIQLKMVGKRKALKVPNVPKKIYFDHDGNLYQKYNWNITCDGKNIIDRLSVEFCDTGATHCIVIKTEDFSLVGKVLEI